MCKPKEAARARVADDPAGHRDRKNRDLKRNSEHGVRDGLHYEPARMSDDMLPTSLPNWKIKRPVARFLVAYSVIPVAVPSPQFSPPWSAEVQPKQLRRARRARYTRKSNNDDDTLVGFLLPMTPNTSSASP